MTPEQTELEQLQARITALLLEELSPRDAAEIRQLIAANPNLASFKNRMQAAIVLVRDSVDYNANEPELRLTPLQRESLLALFRTRHQSPLATLLRFSWLAPVAAAAGLMVLLTHQFLSVSNPARTAMVALGYGAKTDSKNGRLNHSSRVTGFGLGNSSDRNGDSDEMDLGFSTAQREAAAAIPQKPANPTRFSLSVSGGAEANTTFDTELATPEASQLGRVVRENRSLSLHDEAKPSPSPDPATPFAGATVTANGRDHWNAPTEESTRGFTPTDAERPAAPPALTESDADFQKLADAGIGLDESKEQSSPAINFARRPAPSATHGRPSSSTTAPRPEDPHGIAQLSDGLQTRGSARGGNQDIDVRGESRVATGLFGDSLAVVPTQIPNQTPFDPNHEQSLQNQLSQLAADPALTISSGRRLESDFILGEKIADQARARSAEAQREKLRIPSTQDKDLKKGQLLLESDFGSARKTPPPTAEPAVEDSPAPVIPSPPSQPKPEVLTAQNPFSTFSLNVSDVSFKLAAAAIQRGTRPDKTTLRSEEFLNAFNYHDPAPAPGAPLAFAWDQAHSPFAHNRDLIRFSIQTAASGREKGRPLNLVLLLDNSGSMERSDRVRIIRNALGVLAQQLTPQDRISVVAFARTPRLWIDALPGGNPQALLQRIGHLNPQGGTNLELALDLAYATAEKHLTPNSNNRVILLTDGAANLGNVDPIALKQTVESFRKRNIALDCFGIGWQGFNDDLLEVLARNGDGRYGFINDPREAATEFADQLAGALRVAASDVKAQVEFNPQRVISYRQIGYEKHQLTREQFRDNTVDAAEIGAAESGTALYAIELNPRGSGPIGTVRVRYKIPHTQSYEEKEWLLPFNPAVPSLDQAYPSMRLAAVATAFAEFLAESPYAANVNLADLRRYLSGVPETFPHDPRPKQLQSMLK